LRNLFADLWSTPTWFFVGTGRQTILIATRALLDGCHLACDSRSREPARGGADMRELWPFPGGGLAVVAKILLVCVPGAAVARASALERRTRRSG
jgi:hypothetical protein